MRVTGLRTEQLENPLGVELAEVRLSWRLETPRAGAYQSAYRIRVAASREALDEGGADLWDSGKVATDSSFDIRYGGTQLKSRQRAWWTVEVWDDEDASAAAEPAFWEMGLIGAGDWTAQWLTVESEEERADREAGLIWIWGDDAPEADPRRFRLRFEAETPVKEASLVLGAAGRLTQLFLDGKTIAVPEPNPHAFGPSGLVSLDLGALKAGEHALCAVIAATPNPRDPRPWRGAFSALLKLKGEDERIQRLTTGAGWRSNPKADVDWTEASFDDEAWPPCRLAERRPRAAWPPTGAMLLRKVFEAKGEVVQARLCATALGAYETFLNGARVGDAYLAPESTDFRHRVLYRVYDVTPQIKAGQNVLGAHVGDGWYASYIAPGGRYAFGPPPRRFLAQLELTFADGTRQVVETGDGWRTTPSPVLMSEIYNGETYDARLEPDGWGSADFDDEAWTPAHLGDPPIGQLVAHIAPPIRITETRIAKSMSEPPRGGFVYDFGQNFAGAVRLRVKGSAGHKVTLRFAEIVDNRGDIDQSNLRAAKATDTYILKGDPNGEVFQPAFTYHGFRYVEVTGYPGRPTLDDLDGLVMQSDLPTTGAFRAGHAGIQQLAQNAMWSQRSNFTGIPTDCPQRDERLGWTGDACVFWDAAAFNMDVYGFTQRFSGDMRDAQTPAGAYPDYAPAARRALDQPAPGWADAGIVLPWTAWRRYGATSIIDANWEAMVRYIRYLEEANSDGLWVNKRGLDFGDWLALDAKQPGDPTTPKDLIGTAWWAYTTGLMIEMAKATGRKDDKAWLTALRARIVAAFQGAYVGKEGRVGNGSQTGFILALKFGLLPQEARAEAAKRLTDEIEGRGGVLSTGFLGTPFSLDVLAEIGRPDLVYDLLLRTEFPSWGYMIAKGATTIWERWNGDTGDVAMNSFNHYALGAVAGFLFRRIAGIEPIAPGFREFLVRPVLDPRVRSAGADYDSVLGRISTDWQWSPGEVFQLTLAVPPGARAYVALPARLGRDIKVVSGNVPQPLAPTPREGSVAPLSLGSGRHVLTVTG